MSILHNKKLYFT